MSDHDHLTFGDEPAPEGLPAAKKREVAKTATEASRTCEKCGGTSIRINRSYDNSKAFCNSCGHNWSITMATGQIQSGGLLQRGLRKETQIEPDWNLAFEDLDDWPEDGTP